MALEEAVDICEQLGARRLWGACWTLLAQLAYYEGDFPRADEMFAQLYTEAQNYGDVLQQAWALGGQGQNRLRLGLFDDACAFLERANRKLADNQELPSQISNYGLLAVAHLRQGNTQRAREAAETAARLLQSVPVPAAYYLLEGYSGFAEVYLTLWEQSGGQTPAARRPLVQHTRQACDALAQYARLFAIGQPRMLLWRGLHIWLNGRPHQAHQTWQAGLDAARSLHMPYEEGLTHYELGRHLSGAARREHLHHAADIFQRLGAACDLDRTQRLL
jgi:tetratricopeptide (TPR) repeat protein